MRSQLVSCSAQPAVGYFYSPLALKQISVVTFSEWLPCKYQNSDRLLIIPVIKVFLLLQRSAVSYQIFIKFDLISMTCWMWEVSK